MTEDDLAGFERYCATTDLPPYVEEDIIPALIAEVRRLRAEVGQLQEALVEDFAARLFYGDKSPGHEIWEFQPGETRADYRKQSRERLGDTRDAAAFLSQHL